jgi:hypothetical protein
MPDLGACQPIQDQIDELEGEVESLQEALGEVPPTARPGIIREILALRRQIHNLQLQLQQCLLHPPTNLVIDGVELTQAIQYFAFNGQGSGFASDNTVPLVGNKMLIARVYVDRTTFSGPPIPPTVTGKLSYAGHPDLTPINGPIPGAPSSSINRGDPNQTLNFRVPAADCTGTVAFTAQVFDPAHPSDPASSSAPFSIAASFDVVPQVRVHGILIHYTGKDSHGNPTDIAAPSGLDLVNTLVYVGKTYPISGFNYTACTVIDFNGDLTVGGGGGCGTGWNQLFGTIWNMRAASTPDANGNRDVFVGLLPSGVPTSGVSGCGGGGVAVAYVGTGSVFAQEIGHAFGRAHAPCGNPGGPDPNYPTYNSYPSASIGEFGVDTSNMQVFNPGSTYDFMSYCGPPWISPYTWVGLKNPIVSGLGGAPAHPDRAGSRLTAGEYLFLNFRMYRNGKVALRNSFHVNKSAPPMETGEPTNVRCDLLAEDGEVLDSHRCQIINPHMDLDDVYVDFYEAIRLDDAWKDRIHSIAFTRDRKVTDTIVVPTSAPTVEVAGMKQGGGGLMRLEWSVKEAEKAPGGKEIRQAVHFILRYSNDGGATWGAVAADLTEPRHVVNLDLLPGGAKCRFQVIASSGIRSSVALTDPVEVARKPRKAYILSPANSGMTFKQGEGVVLLGGGFSPDFETTDFDEVVWTSDRDGVIGTGYGVITHSLSTGRHRISIDFPDGLGSETSASVFVTIK